MSSQPVKKHQQKKKPQSSTTISSLQRGRQGCLWCCPSFCAASPLPKSRVSNPKHVALLFLTGRSRSQLPKEFQREHSICTRAGRIDVLSLLSLKEMRVHPWKFHQGEKQWNREGGKKKARQRGFREDSPLSDFPTSKKKASSVFSSSDTFVPPLHARRHVPRDAQKAPAASGQLRVHTYYLPPALTASRWHFTPITPHFPWLRAGGTDRGACSPRELQQVCIQQPGCSFILHAGTGELLFCPSSWGTCLAVSHSPTSVHSDFPAAGLHFSFPPSILFLFSLSICPRGYLFLPISGLPRHLCRGAGQMLPVFSLFTQQSRPAAWNCCPWIQPGQHLHSPGAGSREHTSQVRKGRLQLSVNWPLLLSAPFAFPSHRKKLLTANPLVAHQGLLLPAGKFGSYQEFSSPWTLQAAPVSAALQRGWVCCTFFYRLTPNTSC